MTDHIVRLSYGTPGHQHREILTVHDHQTYHVPLRLTSVDGPISELLVNVMDPRPTVPGSHLVDARKLDAVKADHTWSMEYLPSRRTLAEILLDVVAHGEVCPSHGMNCACVDQYIREIKQHVHRVVPEMERITLPDDQWCSADRDDNWTYEPVKAEAARRAKHRIYHVLSCVLRAL